jgi:uncharacterized protein (DUF305 family)
MRGEKDEAGGRHVPRFRLAALVSAVVLGVVLGVGAMALVAQGWMGRQWLTSGGSDALKAEALSEAKAVSGAAEASDGQGLQGPVNIGFAQDMSLHHEQALTMARLALAQGSPQVQALAQGIVNQQLKEIGYMQGWLMLWDAPGTSASDDMPWMRQAYVKAKRRDPVYEQFIESCIAGKGMPGMASVDELDQLATLHKTTFDSRFLALMVRHHQGAVVMARFASEHAELEVVRGFARSIAAEQRREMIQMMTLLSARKSAGS